MLKVLKGIGGLEGYKSEKRPHIYIEELAARRHIKAWVLHYLVDVVLEGVRLPVLVIGLGDLRALKIGGI